MKIAVVGATGVVGSKMLQMLAKAKLPISEIIPVASEKSLNKTVGFGSSVYKICSVTEAVTRKPHVTLFSAGSDLSLQKAELFAAQGSLVVDNSSAWRMHDSVKLIVPEVNGSTITKDDRIIANPNCSTIQLVMVLKPLHDAFNIKRVVISTYQAVSGSGQLGITQLKQERESQKVEHMAYKYNIDLNIIPQIDVFMDLHFLFSI